METRRNPTDSSCRHAASAEVEPFTLEIVPGVSVDSTLAQPSFAAVMTSEMVMLMPKLVTAMFIFAFGACVGSFLNVVAHRMPTGRSVVSPPSRCPRCGWRLTWHENLPVLGWLLLRGRCRRCRGRISVQYPLVELLVGVMFAGSYLLFFA